MSDASTVTAVTWNAQGSRGMNVPAVAAAMEELGPDLVLLQEVQRAQLGALRAAMRCTDARWRFKHWSVRVPAEGLGILSELPLHEVKVQTLARFAELWSWRRRIAVHAAVVVDDRLVRVVDVHLGAGVSHAERARQARALLGASPHAALIGGDLNAEPDDAELAPFADRGFVDAERRLHGDRPSPATNWVAGPRTQPPTQRLDYLMTRPSCEVLEARVPEDWPRWAALSDHLPVVARLRL
jgi:endonuclease/exonuclease/phosphatase family metal-dependent hydrolase